MMMRSLPPLAKFIFIGVAAVLLLAGIGYWLNMDSQVRLDVKILKVRVVPTGDSSSLAVVDFRVRNLSGALFQLKKLTIVVTTAGGEKVEGQPVTQDDLDRVLDYHGLYGKRHTEMLKARDRLRPKTEQDRTAAAGFNVSEQALAGRKGLVMKLQDADGAIIEVAETGR